MTQNLTSVSTATATKLLLGVSIYVVVASVVAFVVGAATANFLFNFGLAPTELLAPFGPLAPAGLFEALL